MTLFLSGMLHLTGGLKLLEDLAVLLAILGLLSSGVAIIIRGATERTRQLARRVEKVRWRPAAGTGKADTAGRRPEERLALQGGLGLTGSGTPADHPHLFQAARSGRVGVLLFQRGADSFCCWAPASSRWWWFRAFSPTRWP